MGTSDQHTEAEDKIIREKWWQRKQIYRRVKTQAIKTDRMRRRLPRLCQSK